MITIATPPIIVACTTARSALSAKNSLNTKIDHGRSGEAGREDAEDSGSAISVLEVASCGSAAANQQHRRDRDCRDRRDDKSGPEEAHGFCTCPRASALGTARTMVCILTLTMIGCSQQALGPCWIARMAYSRLVREVGDDDMLSDLASSASDSARGSRPAVEPGHGDTLPASSLSGQAREHVRPARNDRWRCGWPSQVDIVLPGLNAL